MKFTIALISAAAATKMTELEAGPGPLALDPQLAALVNDDTRPIADRLAGFTALTAEQKWELGFECHFGELDCDAVGEAIEEYCTGEAGAEDENCAHLNEFIGELEAMMEDDDDEEYSWDTEAYCEEFESSWCFESEDGEDEDSFESYGMDSDAVREYCSYARDHDPWCEEAEARLLDEDDEDDESDEDDEASFESYGYDTEDIREYCAVSEYYAEDEAWCNAFRAARGGSSEEEEGEWSSTEEEEEEEEGDDAFD